MGERTCSVDGCNNPHDSQGYCGRHYTKWRRHGDPLWQPPSTSQRFWLKVIESGDCWLWTGAGQRYGNFKTGGRDHLAHRFAYEELVGPIPAGLTLDHLCLNKRCVNPSHLDPVPIGENLRRADVAYGIRSAVTHCPHGHEYTEANTARRNGRRYCRACNRARAARNRARRREVAS